MKTQSRKELEEQKAAINAGLEKLEDYVSTPEYERGDDVQMTLINIEIDARRTLCQVLLERIVRMPEEA